MSRKRGKPSLKEALGASMIQEEDALDARFARAEALVSGQEQVEAPKRSKKSKKEKPKKDQKRVVRHTFSMPPESLEALETLQQQAMLQGIGINKSELIRAGILQLQSMKPQTLARALSRVQKLKTGRPAKLEHGERPSHP